MELIVTPAGGSNEHIADYVRTAQEHTDAKYGFQVSLDRSVQVADLAKASGWRRSWIEGAVQRQTRGKPPFDIAYLDLEPEGGWLWKIASPNHPELFVPERDGPTLTDMLRVAAKTCADPRVRWGYYRFPHFPRRSALNDRTRDSIKRVWGPVEDHHDYITVNQYLNRNDTRSALQRLDDAEEMVRFARQLAGDEKPVYVMVWHSWLPIAQTTKHYVAMALAAKRAGADGLWLWANVGNKATRTVERAKLLDFLPHWNEINRKTRRFVNIPKPSAIAKMTSAYANLRGGSWAQVPEGEAA